MALGFSVQQIEEAFAELDVLLDIKLEGGLRDRQGRLTVQGIDILTLIALKCQPCGSCASRFQAAAPGFPSQIMVLHPLTSAHRTML